jgi:hypothetical protein
VESNRSVWGSVKYTKTLTKESEEEFLVRGSHGRVSRCTLPIWTPSEIVDSMNERFG